MRDYKWFDSLTDRGVTVLVFTSMVVLALVSGLIENIIN